MGLNAGVFETPVAAAVDALCAVLRGERVDWPPAEDSDFYRALTEQAAYHGVDALLGHLLKPTPVWGDFPAAAREALLLRLRQYGAVELARRHDLEALLTALQHAGVGVLLLKGVALAYTLYPEPHLRSRVDTDLFIDTADIRQIRQQFTELGYELAGCTYKSHQFNSLRRDFGHGTVNYDVHWRSSNRARYARVLGYAEALRESVPVPGLAGARTLRPDHALLQACMHRAANPEHDPDRLIWLYDIHLLVNAMALPELLDFAERAVRENLQTVCRGALQQSHLRFATQLPAAAAALLATPATARTGLRRRFQDSQLALIIDDLKMLPNRRSRLELVREFLFPSGQFLLARYHKRSALWLPLLYIRYLLGGFMQRMSLR